MRVALVGCGRWGRFILRDLVSLGCEVTVVARSDESRFRAKEGGASSIVAAIDELSEMDGLVVATPTSTHASVLHQVLDRFPCPVFVEKPLTDDPSTLGSLVAKGVERLFVMDKWRYHPGVEMMAAIARSGEFGRVRAIQTRRLSWGQSHGDVDAVWILLPHDLAIVTEILGHLPEAVAAVGTKSLDQDAALTGLLGPKPAVSVEVSSVSLIRERRIHVEFDDAVIVLDDAYASGLRVMRRGGTFEELRELGDEMPLLKELTAFVAHMDGGPPPRSTVREASLVVERIAELREMAGI